MSYITSDNLEPPFWLSVDYREPKHFYEDVTISIVAEAGVKRQYAGIRLVLIQIGTGIDLLDPRPDSPVLSYKNSHRDPNKISRKSILRGEAAHQTFCTVVLTVTGHNRSHGRGDGTTRDGFCVVKPLTRRFVEELRNTPSPVPRHSPCYLATLSDDLYLWPANTSFEQVNGGPLEISYGILFPERGMPTIPGCPRPVKKEVLTVRILPCEGRQSSPFASIPLEILDRIGFLLGDLHNVSCASLVHKSWAPIMAGFLKRLGWVKGSHIIKIDRFASLMKSHRNDWAFLITALDLRDFDIEERPRYYVRDVGELLNFTPNLRMLKINLFVITWAGGPLSELKYVNEFACDNYAMKGQDASRLAPVQRIQEIIARWDNLKGLTMSGVGRNFKKSPSPSDTPSQKPAYQLERLTIDNEQLSNQQILYFVSCPSRTPRLYRLDLENITGIEPEAMGEFFRAVASTLVEVRLINCDTILMQNTGRFSTSVLQGALPEMSELSFVELRGRVLDRSILNWTPNVTDRETELKLYVENTDLLTEQGVNVDLELNYGQIGWKKIWVGVMNRGGDINWAEDESLGPVLSKAEERGFILEFFALASVPQIQELYFPLM